MKLNVKKKEPEFKLDDWADDSWGIQDTKVNKKGSSHKLTKSSPKKLQAQKKQPSSGWGTGWEEDNWGEMEEQGDIEDPFAADGEGWDDDNDDWGSIEDPAPKATKPSSPKVLLSCCDIEVFSLHSSRKQYSRLIILII